VTPIPAYGSAAIVLASTLLSFACWFGLRAAAPAAVRPLVTAAAGLFLGAWLYAALSLSIAGVFHPGARGLAFGGSSVPPLVGALLFLVVALAMASVLFFLVPPLRRTLDEIPGHWLVAVHALRVMGFLVLSAGLSGVLPIAFAGPAGVGDGLTGLAAPFVAYTIHQRRRGAQVAALLWNMFGLADLIVVAVLCALSTPATPGYRPALGDNSNFALFPTGLLPIFCAPLFILLHLLSIRALLRPRSAEGRRR
jgi:hypothetical protein